jgi:hypothetical protein
MKILILILLYNDMAGILFLSKKLPQACIDESTCEFRNEQRGTKYKKFGIGRLLRSRAIFMHFVILAAECRLFFSDNMS